MEGTQKFTYRCKSSHAHGCRFQVKFVFNPATKRVTLLRPEGEGWQHTHNTPSQLTRGLEPGTKQLIVNKMKQLPNIRPKCARASCPHKLPPLGTHTPLPHLDPRPLSRELKIYLKEECNMTLDKAMETQVDNFRSNNRSKLPSHELGISSWATCMSLAKSNDIHTVLAAPGATVHSAGVIGNAALLTLTLTPIPLP